MIAWICSTSGRAALRVRPMDPLQGSQVLPRFTQSLLHAIRSSAAGNIVAGKHGFESQMAVNVIGKCRAEFPQLSQRKVLQLAILLDTLLHGMSNRLMCQTEGNTAFREVRSGRHGVHESFFASRAH